MREVLRLSLRLLLFTLAAGLLLAVTNAVTEGPIAEQAELTSQRARMRVLTEASTFESTDVDLTNYPHVDSVYVGRDGDAVVGYTFSLSPMGFKAEIAMTLGVNAAGAVTRLSIDSQSETAGLGTRIADESYLSQYVGMAASGEVMDAQIDTISGATVSSRAVKSAVGEALTLAAAEFGVVGAEDLSLADSGELTDEDVHRVSLIEGGRTLSELTPYGALGYEAILKIYEVSVKGETGFVFELREDGVALTLAIMPDGTISAAESEDGEYASLVGKAASELKSEQGMAGQAARFYIDNLAGREEA